MKTNRIQRNCDPLLGYALGLLDVMKEQHGDLAMSTARRIGIYQYAVLFHAVKHLKGK